MDCVLHALVSVQYVFGRMAINLRITSSGLMTFTGGHQIIKDYKDHWPNAASALGDYL